MKEEKELFGNKNIMKNKKFFPFEKKQKKIYNKKKCIKTLDKVVLI